jgi:iron-sulfur cluster assembly protein
MALHCSPTAIEQIKKLQAKRVAEGKRPALGLRIGIRGGGCNGFGYLFEWCEQEPRATDKVFDFADGDVRIFCDPKSLIYLDNTTLDYVTGLMGHGFKFENPNAKGTCGCGESVQF